MSKRKILFCIENVRQGGISKALESILPLIDANGADVKIFSINQNDGPYKSVFKRHFYRKQNWLLYALSAYYTEHHGVKKAWMIFVKAIGKIIKRVFKRDLLSFALSQEAKRISKEEFDVVIAFSEGIITHFCPEVKTKRRIAWIHLDYERYLSYNNGIDEKDTYASYDSIVIPSDHCSKSFIKVFPQFKEKVMVIPNMVDHNKINELSQADDELDNRFTSYDSFKIVSVGRICYEKRFFEIPSIVKELKLRNLQFKWYIIGNGSQKETEYLLSQIQKHGVEEDVVMLGVKNNPYPYIRRSQLLACTSLTETFCYAIAEAKVLGTPVITTDFGTAYEVMDEEHGIICNLHRFADNIYKLASDRNKYQMLKKQLNSYNHSNRADRLTELLGI